MTVREAREAVGLSRPGLARAAGLQYQTVYDIEAGKNRRPTHEVVTRILRALREHGLVKLTAEQIFPVPEFYTGPVEEEQERPA